MRLLPYGPLGWLVELPADDVVGYRAGVARRDHPSIAELVPAAQTVLVRLHPGASTAEVGAWLASIDPVPVAADTSGSAVELGVIYDGDDLEHVAAACGLAVADVIDRHAAGHYTCAFCGFAPGFSYLTGLDPTLALPRRPTPRTRVPMGAVAIADAYSAVYPSTSPGGWHLIGRTHAVLWDPSRDPPALVPPGTAVRFVAT